MNFTKKVSCILLIATIIFSFASCSTQNVSTKPGESSGRDTKSGDTSSQKPKPSKTPDPYENLKMDPHAKLDGTFIQSWLCAGWSDERWQEELQSLKDVGMTYLIMGDACTKSTEGNWYSFYPSQIPGIKEGYGGVDVIDAALRNCQKFGIKVFVGMGLDDKWWGTFINDPEWLNASMEQSNKIVDELYANYYNKYKDTFYGWYWVPEFFNDTSFAKSSPNREARIKVLSDAMNINLDHITKLDPSLPLLLSPYVNIDYTSANDNYEFFADLLKITHFRKGDILCPQDSVSAVGERKIKYMDAWTKSFRKAADTKEGMKFWSNNENFDTYEPNKSASANLERFIRQIQISSKYAEHIVTFAYSHYYSPYNAIPGFHKTYEKYVKEGTLEKEPPSEPKNVTAEMLDAESAIVKWEEATDNIQVAGYKIVRNGDLCKTIYATRDDGRGAEPAVATHFTDNDAGKSFVNGKIEYEVYAYDCAGNESNKVSVIINQK